MKKNRRHTNKLCINIEEYDHTNFIGYSNYALQYVLVARLLGNLSGNG
jgi:hypothetical protein